MSIDFGGRASSARFLRSRSLQGSAIRRGSASRSSRYTPVSRATSRVLASLISKRNTALAPPNAPRRVRRDPKKAVSCVHSSPAVPAVLTLLRRLGCVQPAVKESVFLWEHQWYPVAAAKDLDPSRPHQVVLLGKRVVIWKAGGEQWVCFEDACPHRQAPLSEGRLESTGELMCGYHGWRFNQTGQAVAVPQVGAHSKDAEQRFSRQRRACALCRPCREKQGLIFVWGCSVAKEQHALLPNPPLSSLMARLGEKFGYGYESFVRGVPGSFDAWMENSLDQSHAPFAHHGVGLHSRGGACEGYFSLLKAADFAPTSFDFSYRFTLDGKTLVDAATAFEAPNLLQLSIKQRPEDGLWIYCTPVDEETTLLIIQSGGRQKKPSRTQALLGRSQLWKHFQRAQTHLHLHNVTDGDAIFMLQQTMNVRERRDEPSSHAYALPGDNDKGVSYWLRWLTEQAGGGPNYSGRRPSDSLWTQGRLQRERLLDRFHQHTEHCSSCSKIFSLVNKARTMTAAATVGLLLELAASLGHSSADFRLEPVSLAAAAGLMMWANRRLSAYRQLFIFKDCRQADLPPPKA